MPHKSFLMRNKSAMYQHHEKTTWRKFIAFEIHFIKRYLHLKNKKIVSHVHEGLKYFNFEAKYLPE